MKVLLLLMALCASAASVSASNCGRMAWFMALDGNVHHGDLVRVAMRSAKERAPSLVPHLIYAGQPDDLTDWFTAQGGRVFFHNLTFFERIKAAADGGAKFADKNVRNYGAWLRFDIPHVWPPADLPDDIERDIVLYTDADVMFLGDVDTCALPQPELLLMGPEVVRKLMINSGVLVMNVDRFRGELPDLLRFADERRWAFEWWDQSALLEYMQDINPRLAAPLPDEYNWKLYWGGPKDDDPRPTIVHFHGPKPSPGQSRSCFDCFVRHGGSIQPCVGCEHLREMLRHTRDSGAFLQDCLALFDRWLTEAI